MVNLQHSPGAINWACTKMLSGIVFYFLSIDANFMIKTRSAKKQPFAQGYKIGTPSQIAPKGL